MPASMKGGFGGEWIHVYIWLNPSAVHLKLPHIVNRLYPNAKKKSLKFGGKKYTTIYKPRRKPLLEMQSARTLILDFLLVSRTV